MSFDYLWHLARWALPVLLLQVAFGPRTLWQARRVLALAVLGCTAWLSAADALAIHSGIWAFDYAHLTGLRIGPVPIEEVAFFFATSSLVAQGVVLLRARKPARAAPLSPSSRSASPWG